MAVLAPDVALRVDAGDRTAFARPPVYVAKGVAAVIRTEGPRYMRLCRVALVNGEPRLVVGDLDHPIAVVALAVRNGRISEIDLVLDRRKLTQRARLERTRRQEPRTRSEQASEAGERQANAEDRGDAPASGRSEDAMRPRQPN